MLLALTLSTVWRLVMNRYLVRPKPNQRTEELLALAQRAATRDRTSNLAEVIKLRNSGLPRDLLKQIDQLVQDNKATSLLGTSSKFGVTGTIILETDPDSIAHIQAVDGVDVLLDTEITLIEPDEREKRRTRKLLDDQLWHLSAIGLKEARSRGMSHAGEATTVAVMDTGIAPVRALKKQIKGAYQIDAASRAMEEKSLPSDTGRHGTHVAGLICGQPIGVAPKAKVIDCTVIPNGRGLASHLVIALEWIAQQADIDVVNISAGFPGYVPEIEDAVASLLPLNILPVAAVGNEGRHRTRSPGNYRDVLSVGASTKQYKVCRFSGSANIIYNGQVYVVPDLVAPGDSVYSCVPDDHFEAWDGSSMATAVVSGLACIAISRARKENKSIPVFDLMEILMEKCQRLETLKDRQGMGMAQVV